jgi:hypothetical protein
MTLRAADVFDFPPSFALAQDLENLLFTESVPLHRTLLGRRRGVTFWIDQFTTLVYRSAHVQDDTRAKPFEMLEMLPGI